MELTLRAGSRAHIPFVPLPPAPRSLAQLRQEGHERQGKDSHPERRPAGHDRDPARPAAIGPPSARSGLPRCFAGLQHEGVRKPRATLDAIDDRSWRCGPVTFPYVRHQRSGEEIRADGVLFRLGRIVAPEFG